jgi:hypothetical protein
MCFEHALDLGETGYLVRRFPHVSIHFIFPVNDPGEMQGMRKEPRSQNGHGESSLKRIPMRTGFTVSGFAPVVVL